MQYVRETDGTVWVLDQWGDRHQPQPVEHRTLWFPMYDPEYYRYDTEVEYCPHISLKFATGWDPEVTDIAWVRCYAPYCPRTAATILEDT